MTVAMRVMVPASTHTWSPITESAGTLVHPLQLVVAIEEVAVVADPDLLSLSEERSSTMAMALQRGINAVRQVVQTRTTTRSTFVMASDLHHLSTVSTRHL